MPGKSFQKMNYVLVILISFFLCGYADTKGLTEVEVALLQRDYEKVQYLCDQLLSSGLEKSQANQVRYYLALSKMQLGSISEARGIFEGLTKNGTQTTLRDKAFLGLFDTYYKEERYKDAYDIGQKHLKKNPDSDFLSQIYLKCARASLKLALWDEAQLYLAKIINQFPDSLEVQAAKQLLEEEHYFAVQVGAFVKRESAEELMQELKPKHPYVYIVETLDQENRKFFRVRVGQLALLDEAKRLKSKLSKQGYPAKIYP